MSYQFQPGPLSAAASAYLTRLARDVDRANRLAVTPPLALTEAGGNKVVYLDSAAVGGGGGAAGEWVPGKVMSGTDSSGYTVRRLELTGANTFAESSPTVEVLAYRQPSNPAVTVPDIPAGQTVLYRESPDTPGLYECTPWGGQRNLSLSQVIPQVTGGGITGSVTCVGGVPVVTLAFTPTTAPYVLSVDLTARDLVGGMTYTLPPPPP